MNDFQINKGHKYLDSRHTHIHEHIKSDTHTPYEMGIFPRVTKKRAAEERARTAGEDLDVGGRLCGFKQVKQFLKMTLEERPGGKGTVAMGKRAFQKGLKY